VERQYSLDLSATAKAAYIRIVRDAEDQIAKGDISGSKVKLGRLVDECMDKIILTDPFNPKRALSGALSYIYRVKKGCLRICYMGASQKNRLVVLFHFRDSPKRRRQE
jgi:mRNA-degrading endonuclease RelE of RelBE toxin-antitoxin system